MSKKFSVGEFRVENVKRKKNVSKCVTYHREFELC